MKQKKSGEWVKNPIADEIAGWIFTAPYVFAVMLPFAILAYYFLPENP